jgi:hypothetical protein
MLLNKIEIDLMLLADPQKRTYRGKDVCYFTGVSTSLDVDSIPPEKFHEEIYHVFEDNKHVKASLEFMKKDSLCTVIGELGFVKAVTLDGEPYYKKCVKAKKVIFKSYTNETIAKMTQNMFEYFDQNGI